MHKKWISAIYSLNIIFQSFFSLLFAVAVMLLLAYLSVERLGAPTWVYVPFIIAGVLFGLFSMIRFVIVASRSVNALERDHIASDEERRRAAEIKRSRKKHDDKDEKGNN